MATNARIIRAFVAIAHPVIEEIRKASLSKVYTHNNTAM
jgi:hypothetical protein